MDTYCIQVRGQVDLAELNALSPYQMTVLSADPLTTCFTIRADQSGLIGLLRHLHNLGVVILAVNWQPSERLERNEK